MSARSRSQNRPSGAAHGVLLVDKESNMTSHDVVARARRAFGTRRVGHAGTLDPMATGLLVVLLGEATKLSSVLSTDRKTYETTIAFGVSTDSLDADGRVTKRLELPPNWLSDDQLSAALASEKQRRVQVPPQVSAVKVDGERAYARARRGLETELEPRDVAVHELTLLERGAFHLRLRVTVSKGYYVRCLARDLGDTLGAPAHLTALRRTHSGPFSVADAAPLPLTGDERPLPLAEAARSCLPALTVTLEGAERLRQGKIIGPDHVSAAGSNSEPREPLWAAFFENRLIALVKPSDAGEFRVQRGVNDPTEGASPLPHPEPGG